MFSNAKNIEINGKEIKSISLENSGLLYEKPASTELTITTQLVFDDNDNQDGNRPSSVTVTLFANGAEVEHVTISEAEGWSHTFTDLPVYDQNGEEIVYGINEDPVAWYNPTINGYTITNTYTPETTSATVRKVWDDNNNERGIRPTSIAMTLSNGQSVVLNDTNGWEATIENLPTMINQQPVTYTWTEQETIGYQIESTQTEGTVTTFTNQIWTRPELDDGDEKPKIPGGT